MTPSEKKDFQEKKVNKIVNKIQRCKQVTLVVLVEIIQNLVKKNPVTNF